MKDYTTVYLVDSKLKGSALAKEADQRCKKALDKTPIWTEKAIPSVLCITPDQFTEFATLSGDPGAKPTGKENFKTSNGYMFEIKVREE